MKRLRKNNHWVGWFYDEVYRSNVEIIWPVADKDVVKYVKDRFNIEYEKDDEWADKCLDIHHEATNQQVNVICVRDWPRKPDATDFALLAHECFHAADHILARRGVTLTPQNTEPYAYLLESIMRRCLVLMDVGRRVK